MFDFYLSFREGYLLDQPSSTWHPLNVLAIKSYPPSPLVMLAGADESGSPSGGLPAVEGCARHFVREENHEKESCLKNLRL